MFTKKRTVTTNKLDSLSDQIWFDIFSFLGIRSLTRLQLINKKRQKFLKSFWRKLAIIHFNYIDHLADRGRYNELYKRLWLQEHKVYYLQLQQREAIEKKQAAEHLQHVRLLRKKKCRDNFIRTMFIIEDSLLLGVLIFYTITLLDSPIRNIIPPIAFMIATTIFFLLKIATYQYFCLDRFIETRIRWKMFEFVANVIVFFAYTFTLSYLINQMLIQLLPAGIYLLFDFVWLFLSIDVLHDLL